MAAGWQLSLTLKKRYLTGTRRPYPSLAVASDAPSGCLSNISFNRAEQWRRLVRRIRNGLSNCHDRTPQGQDRQIQNERSSETAAREHRQLTYHLYRHLMMKSAVDLLAQCCCDARSREREEQANPNERAEPWQGPCSLILVTK